jgi:hypothetical protein
MYKEIKEIEFELNTICQSFCPTCIRYTIGPDENGNDMLYRNPGVIYNQVVDLKNIERLVTSPMLSQDDTVFINMIGTAGEPVAHPQFIEIVNLIKQHVKEPMFNIHTNGGVKNKSFFKDLALAMQADDENEGWQTGSKGGTLGRVCFSFDGVDQESNEIYRIGVDWARAMENALAFIEAGGYATWQFIIFEHNKHLHDQAKQMAKELGFAEFESRENIAPDGIDISTAAANNKIDIKTKPRINKKPPGWKPPVPYYDYIDDQCFSKAGIFLAPDGKIWPCCMMPSVAVDKNMQTLFGEARLEKEYGNQWNNLENNSLEQIMKHPWWEQLHRWVTMEEQPCDLCARECGATSETRRFSDINEVNTQF